MMILLPFMDILALACYLKRLLKEVPAIRLAYLAHSQDIPAAYSNRLRMAARRFLHLSKEAREYLSKQELSQTAGEMATTLYFVTIEVQELYKLIDDYEVPMYHRMRNIRDEQVIDLATKLTKLIKLLKVA